MVIEAENKIIPIEIKSGKNIRLKDLSGLTAFLNDYKLKQAYVVTMDTKPYRLNDKITIIPWNYL